VWVECVSPAGDKRGDYMLCLGTGMVVRDQAEAMYAWSGGGTKHQISVDFHDLVRAELGRWRGEAATVTYNIETARKAAEENLAGVSGRGSRK
jgi:hypothetical protein